MNDENRDLDAEVKADEAAGMLNELQDEVESLQEQLRVALDRVEELEATPVVAAAPAGDAELQALASTVRTAQRNGHPDAVKHLDALLRTLGA